MKKLITGVIAAAALLFGMTSCSGDLHDAQVMNLSAGGIAGAMNGWDNTTVWTSVEGNVYTYEFTATDTSVEWKVLVQAGNWNGGAYRGATVPADGTTVAMVYDNKTGAGGNNETPGTEKGAKYKITVTVSGLSASAKIEKTGSASLPTPYILNGLFVGTSAKIGGNAWSCNSDTILFEYTVDDASGEVTYTKDFVASGATDDMKIVKKTWKGGYANTAIESGKDFVELTNELGSNGEVKAASKISGLTADGAYRLIIKTTPEEKVFAKVYPISKITYKFEVTGLEEENKAWMNGTFWGSGWPQGWPISAWGTPGDGLSAADSAVADSTGVAKFSSRWDASTVAKPGETLSYTFKAIASSDDWASADKFNPSDNLTCDVEVSGDATYLISVNAATEEVTVTKQ